MKKPAISVVMSAYNTEVYIKEAIDSIVAQTFMDFELIIVNDGSTDTTLEIINNYSDPRIRIINNKHDFIDSLNRGVTAAKGRYIARMDSDDIMSQERLQIQYDFMENNSDVDVCGGWMQLFGLCENEVKVSLEHEEIELNAIYGSPLCNATTMMRTEIRNLFEFKDNLFHIYKKGYLCAEDYKLWTDLLIKGCKLKNIPFILHKYRIYESQSTSVFRKEMQRSTDKIQSEYIEQIMENIIRVDEVYYNILDNAVKLLNSSNITFYNLKTIVQSIASNLSNRLFTGNKNK